MILITSSLELKLGKKKMSVINIASMPASTFIGKICPQFNFIKKLDYLLLFFFSGTTSPILI